MCIKSVFPRDSSSLDMENWPVKLIINYLVIPALALICVATSARAEFIVNGGFETGNFSGWTISGQPGVNWITNTSAGYNAHSGNHFALLGPIGSLGYLSQTFTDPNPGEKLTISLYLASNGTTPNEFQVTFNGVTLFDETKIPATGSSTPYPYTHLVFDVTSQSSNTLQLGFRDDPSFLALDDVSVTDPPSVVPAPSSLLLLGESAAALLGLVWHSRRRRRILAA